MARIVFITVVVRWLAEVSFVHRRHVEALPVVLDSVRRERLTASR